MNHASVIIKPVITEKTISMSKEGKYTFFVNLLAGKHDVADAVKKIFNVNPLTVNIIRYKNQRRRINLMNPRKGKAQKKIVKYKKAIVQLSMDEKLDYFDID